MHQKFTTGHGFMKNRFIIIAIIFIVLVGGTVAVLVRVSSPIPLTHSVVFEITEGEGVWKIAQELSAQNIIRSSVWFVVQTFFSGNFSSFKPGIYELSSTSVGNLIHVLSLGPQEVRVTIVPGMTLQEIDTLFSQRGIVPVNSLKTIQPTSLRTSCSVCTYAKNLEGLFTPETYQFYRGSDPHVVAQSIAGVSEEVLHTVTNGTVFTDRELYEKIIIASLLEKEVQSYADKQLVAGIIYKRISLGMPLQIDASVLYGACLHKVGECTLTREDFKKDASFNTYLHKGLPPTPIASPSLDSLRAAFHPQASAYLYYLSDPATGATHFSKTFDEHNTKRGTYLNLE